MNIVITGGTKGIGKAIAEKFAQEGFNIAICARTKEDLKKLKKQLKKIYPKGSICLLYTSPSPRDATLSRMPSSA